MPNVFHALLCAALMSACAAGASPVKSVLPARNDNNPKADVHITSAHLSAEHKGYSVDVCYPRFSGHPASLINTLNRLTKHIVNTNIPAQPGAAGDEPEYSCTYKTFSLTDKSLSIAFEFIDDLGPHHRCWNLAFYPKPRRLPLREVLPHKLTDNALSDLCIRQLHAKLKNDLSLPADTLFDRAAFADFNFNRQGITFTFSPGYVANASLGSPSVFISYKSMKQCVISDKQPQLCASQDQQPLRNDGPKLAVVRSLDAQQDAQGVDFSLYMTQLKYSIQRHWHPPKNDTHKRIVVTFKAATKGQLSNLNIVQSSGLPALDKSVLDAVTNATPFPDLPNGADKTVDIQFTFEYINYPSHNKQKPLDPAVQEHLDKNAKNKRAT